MSLVQVLCPIEKRGSKTALLSPTVGLAKILVANGQPLGGGQIVFELWRLQTCFLVQLPQELFGLALHFQRNEQFFVAFHDVVIEVDHSSSSLHEPSTKQEESAPNGVPILSPMDGMFYLSPSPTDAPFVKVGDSIMPGQTIGLIEVMKSFYPLKYQGAAPTIIIAIHLSNASPVKTGTKLFDVA